VIVPTHSRPHLLQRTLRSLIAQTFTDFHVIVVDDVASHIPPYAELQLLQGRYTFIIRSAEPGPASSRNVGLDIVHSGYVIFLDDDDTFEPDHLQNMAEAINQSRPAIAFCNLQVQNEDRTTVPPTSLERSIISIGGADKNSVFVRNSIPNSCLTYRYDVVAGVRYNCHMRIYEDWDFLLHCLRSHDLTHVPVHSVVIHKSIANAPENYRRGNTRDDLIVQTMLQLYQIHPAPCEAATIARDALMRGEGIAADAKAQISS
jgi:glycosyltransferase involved in cell wall biosynthesis